MKVDIPKLVGCLALPLTGVNAMLGIMAMISGMKGSSIANCALLMAFHTLAALLASGAFSKEEREEEK